jgi:signal transduction histidine kinase/Tfp pilus assembly protein PilF
MKQGTLIILLMAGAILLPSAHSFSQDGFNPDDTTLIHRSIKLANTYDFNFTYDSSMYYATQALQLSGRLLQLEMVKSDQDLLNKIRILKIRSYVVFAMAVRRQNLQAAEDSLMAAHRLCRETGNIKEEAAILGGLGKTYEHKGQNDRALQYLKKSLELYQKSGDPKQYANELINMGLLLRDIGKYGESLEKMMESLQIGRQVNDSTTIIESLLGMGFIYAFVEKWGDALKCQREALEIYEEMNDFLGIARIHNDMGVTYMKAGKLDSALIHHHAALDIRLKSKDSYNTFASYLYIGDILAKKGNITEAIAYYENGLPYGNIAAFKITVVDAHLLLGDYYLMLPNSDKAMQQFKRALQLSREIGDPTGESRAAMGLAKIYLKKNERGIVLPLLKQTEKTAPGSILRFRKDIYKDIADAYYGLGDFENAYINSMKYSVAKDSALTAENLDKITRLTNKLEFENKLALQKESNEKLMAINQAQINRARLTRNIFLSGMLLAVVLVVIIFIRFVEKKKLNKKLNETLSNLLATQAQLVQAEKMASLGELTAGIAHEIKNPLNFVNNFSEVSRELLHEMKNELYNKNEAEVIKLIDKIEQNLNKINQHGKRADSIIKGMLLHSRGSSGEKTPTDINDLLDQNVNLAYHGLRAQNKEFNIAIEKDYDDTLEKVKVFPQDISRVFLNLINNACYAAYDKKKKVSDNSFSPLLRVVTKNLNEEVEIRIVDNGNGISKDILDKIFQPFFTTKPTGEGTGLGLSLSYDVVTKVHGGEINFNTKEGSYTEFIITLPKS